MGYKICVPWKLFERILEVLYDTQHAHFFKSMHIREKTEPRNEKKVSSGYICEDPD